jgi:hypothetical protein
MGKMKELELEINELLERGERPAYIARVLNVPVSFVYDVVEKQHSEQYSPYETVNS